MKNIENNSCFFPRKRRNINTLTLKHFIIQLMHNIKYVDTIKVIKCLKVIQHVSDHRGSIIREPCTVLGQKFQEWFHRVR